MLLCVQARLQTKWLRMLFAQAYGEATVSGGRDVFLRKLPYGTTEEIPVKSVRSHIVKHGASDNAAASGVPWPVSMQVIAPHSFHVMSQSIRISLLTAPLIQSPCARQLEHHANKSQFRTYQREGGPRSRRVAAAAERPTGTATHGPCVLQPGCYACCQDGAHPRQPLACSRGKDSTARSILICFTEYTQSFPCVYTHRSPKYTHRSKCIHIHTVVYTHYHCVYTHRHTPEYTYSVSMYTHPDN